MNTLSLFDFYNHKNLKGIKIKTLKYIDLFCGAGGFSLGFDKSGFQNIFSVDIQKDFCETYKVNFPSHNLVEKDIAKISNIKIKEFVRVVSVVNPKYFVMENVARLYTHNNHKTKEEIIKDFNKLGYKVECNILNSSKSHSTYLTVKDAIESLPILKSREKSSLLNHSAMNHLKVTGKNKKSKNTEYLFIIKNDKYKEKDV